MQDITVEEIKALFKKSNDYEIENVVIRGMVLEEATNEAKNNGISDDPRCKDWRNILASSERATTGCGPFTHSGIKNASWYELSQKVFVGKEDLVNGYSLKRPYGLVSEMTKEDRMTEDKNLIIEPSDSKPSERCVDEDIKNLCDSDELMRAFAIGDIRDLHLKAAQEGKLGDSGFYENTKLLAGVEKDKFVQAYENICKNIKLINELFTSMNKSLFTMRTLFRTHNADTRKACHSVLGGWYNL